MPLYNGPGEPRNSLPDVSAALPLDVCVLGMGDDMHTASLFPGSPELPTALNPDDGATVMAITAPDAPEPRVTLTAPVLAAAPRLYVLIKGAKKRATLDRALATSDPLAAPHSRHPGRRRRACRFSRRLRPHTLCLPNGFLGDRFDDAPDHQRCNRAHH